MKDNDIGLCFDATITAKEARKNLSKPVFPKQEEEKVDTPKSTNVFKYLTRKLRGKNE